MIDPQPHPRAAGVGGGFVPRRGWRPAAAPPHPDALVATLCRYATDDAAAARLVRVLLNRPEAAAEPALRALEAGPSPRVRWRLLEVLAFCRPRADRRVVDPLIAGLIEAPATAALLIAAHGDPRAGPALAEAIRRAPASAARGLMEVAARRLGAAGQVGPVPSRADAKRGRAVG
ncbi:MAG: hypothetical protein KC620_01670 [Myxococcales bacterium]|nr:hypothetical protein [Myxococcales bacterium]